MNTINPAWQELLSSIPQEVHSLVIPHLTKWDENFQKTQTELNALKPYQPLVDNNIELDRVANALKLSRDLEQDPTGTIKNISEAWELGFVDKTTYEQAVAGSSHQPTPEELELGDMGDIANHPLIGQLTKKLEEIQTTFSQSQQAQQEAQEIAEFEKNLTTLLEKPGNETIPRELVHAYMAQGFDGDEAVTRVKGFLAGGVQVPTTETPTVPNLLGGDATGSGIPDSGINVGTLSKGGTEDLVIKMLEQSAAANNQG